AGGVQELPNMAARPSSRFPSSFDRLPNAEVAIANDMQARMTFFISPPTASIFARPDPDRKHGSDGNDVAAETRPTIRATWPSQRRESPPGHSEYRPCPGPTCGRRRR